MNNSSDCVSTRWSDEATKTLQPLLYICLLATVVHLLFWSQLLTYPSVRQWSMQWVYAYLLTDLLLLVRFFLLYIYRSWSTCVSPLLRMLICYCEAIFDNYLNLLQSYILLALNICRYLQIAHNHNVYSSNRRLIVVGHLLIYLLPLGGHLLAIGFDWSDLQAPPGDACDLLPVSLLSRVVFLLLSYFIPVLLTLVFLFLSLDYVRNTDGIRTPQIVDARVKFHRQLVVQSSVFYSLWLLLWSPHLLLFPFFYKNSPVGTVAQILNYLSITIDPVVIAALDVRFLRAWRSTGEHLRHRFLQ